MPSPPSSRGGRVEGSRKSRRRHSADHPALPDAAAEPHLHRRYQRPAARRHRRPEEGAGDRGEGKADETQVVEAEGVAPVERLVATNMTSARRHRGRPGSIFYQPLPQRRASVWRVRPVRCRPTQGSFSCQPRVSWPRVYSSFDLSPSLFSHSAHQRAAADNSLTDSAPTVETARDSGAWAFASAPQPPTAAS